MHVHLESDADAVLQSFDRTYSGYLAYQLDRGANKEYPGSVPLEEVRKNRAQIQDGVREFSSCGSIVAFAPFCAMPSNSRAALVGHDH